MSGRKWLRTGRASHQLATVPTYWLFLGGTHLNIVTFI